MQDAACRNGKPDPFFRDPSPVEGFHRHMIRHIKGIHCMHFFCNDLALYRCNISVHNRRFYIIAFPNRKVCHRKMNRAGLEGKDAVVIGHAGHQEVTGTIGQYMGDPSKVHVILTPEDVAALNISDNAAIFATQTTLSVDETAKTVTALKERFPHIEGPKTDDTCFATQHRQGAVKKLAQICDVVLVAGSKNSSNSNRLREVAASCGAQAYLVEDHLELQSKWFDGIKAVGLTAGASVPEYVVDGILKFLREKSNCDVEEVGEAPVKRSFALPQGV